MTEEEDKSDLRPIMDTPYLSLMGELWNAYCDALGENWPIVIALHCIGDQQTSVSN